jgi:ribosome maturation factor RimP
MNWMTIIEQAAQGLGYELVSTERTPGGLLRVTIDFPWNPAAPVRWITAEDCEKLTRQLQYALEVDGLNYSRLEVSSPGIDRPLKNERDLERFSGEAVDVTLKESIGQVGQDQVEATVGHSRKKFRGILAKAESGWMLACQEPPIGTPPPKGTKKPKVQTYSLGFAWDEIKEARLAPLVNFKGRGSAPADETAE